MHVSTILREFIGSFRPVNGEGLFLQPRSPQGARLREDDHRVTDLHGRQVVAGVRVGDERQHRAGTDGQRGRHARQTQRYVDALQYALFGRAHGCMHPHSTATRVAQSR